MIGVSLEFKFGRLPNRSPFYGGVAASVSAISAISFSCDIAASSAMAASFRSRFSVDSLPRSILSFSIAIEKSAGGFPGRDWKRSVRPSPQLNICQSDRPRCFVTGPTSHTK